MKLLIFLAFVAVAVAERRRFDGCQVWELTPKSENELQELLTLYKRHSLEDEAQLIFWEEPRRINDAVPVLVCPSARRIMRNFLTTSKMEATVQNTDIQKGLDEQWARTDAKQAVSSFDYDDGDYNTFEDIMEQLDVLQANCPEGVTCVVEEIGSSYEGRPMKIFRISKEGADRKGIWMDSVIHAREWLAGATNLGILSRLVNEYGSDPDATRLVDTYDWHILPVFNPDGYSYTWTDDRFWRKNRTPNQGSTCLGTDLNRNHNFMWGTPGADVFPCSITYRGATAASEPEVAIVERAGEELRGSLILWISWHTYARYLLFPYGTVDAQGDCIISPDEDDQRQVAEAGQRAIEETNNESWQIGSFCDLLYAGSGTTQDWAYGVGLAKYTYTPELRGDAFNPGPEDISPSIEENWNGLKAMVQEIEAIEGF